MLTPEKTYSNNPFVDNVVYYSKLLAMNCTIKDSDEALANETKESLYAGDVYIACIEKKSTYDMFSSIPKEILEKYITSVSNIDLFAKSPSVLKRYLDGYSDYNKRYITNQLSFLARTVYIDHFDIMTAYIDSVGPTWLEDNLELYSKCKDGTATYLDLFRALPTKTNLRIFKRYLSNHDYLYLSKLWQESTNDDELLLSIVRSIPTDFNNAPMENNTIYNNKVAKLNTDYTARLLSMESTDSQYYDFEQYVNNRTDYDDLRRELANINKAMRDVFISHYEMMKDRKYFSMIYSNDGIDEDNQETREEDGWNAYFYDKKTFDLCKSNKATYYDLYDLFPSIVLRDCLNTVLGESVVDEYFLMNDVEFLVEYFKEFDQTKESQSALNNMMIKLYRENYQLYLNTDIYYKCQQDLLDFYDLIEYLPFETVKTIILTQFKESTNLDTYANDKNLLNLYLDSLGKEDAKRIKNSINEDMREWYPNNHVEKNNYYRALIGLPPMLEDGTICEDSLLRSYDINTASFKELGNEYINQAPTNIYPTYHWRQEFYKYDAYDVSILEDYDLINSFLAACGGSRYDSRYKYLNYLGDNRLDLYACRKAQEFQIIGIPSIDDEVFKRTFLDMYNVNRDYVIRAVYSDAYKFQSDYYNKFIIIFILFNTIMDCIGKIPDFIINRDVFDARCIRYLFESYGVPYYSEIPLKYQQAMLKNLNILIKYKSSTKNMVDICSIFGFNDVKLFEYYIMKDKNVNVDGSFVLDENNDINYDNEVVYVLSNTGDMVDATGRRFAKLSDVSYLDEDYYYKTIKVQNDDGSISEKKIINNDRSYFVYDSINNEMIPLKDTTYFKKIKANTEPATLKFVKVPIQEQLSAYNNNTDYVFTYDEITNSDPYWDGGLDHEELKRKIMDYEFNSVKSKFISIETATDLTEMAFDASYFFNMLFDNYYREDLLTLNIDAIDSGHTFRFADVICYLFALGYYYNGLADNIMYSPTQILHVKGYNFNQDLNEILQDPNIFTQYDQYGPLQDYEKVNIFDINERIEEDGYDYQEVFNVPLLYLKSFNMDADIDALNKWLQENYSMSLSDFVIDEETGMTLQSFYSQNNSAYQKDIFNNDMLPVQYNNEIKYGYNYDLLEKSYFNDISTNSHTYIKEKVDSINNAWSSYGYVDGIMAIVPKNSRIPTYNELLQIADSMQSVSDLYNDNYVLTSIFGYSDELAKEIEENIGKYYLVEVLNDSSYSDGIIYVISNKYYAIKPHANKSNPVAIYNQFIDEYKTGNSYSIKNKQWFILNNGSYEPLVNGNIRIKDNNGYFIFGADKVYIDTGKGNMLEVTDDKYFSIDSETGYKILNYNESYYDYIGDSYVIKPEYCYIKAEKNGEIFYLPLSDISNYNNTVFEDSDCFIMEEDSEGNKTFVRFDYTDYYIRTHNDDEQSNEMKYVEQDLFVKSVNPTDYYELDADGNKVYYKKIKDFYAENDYTIYIDVLYVKIDDNTYVEESNLLSPMNCYYYDYSIGGYNLVSNSVYSFVEYAEKRDVRFILIKQENNDYHKYALSDDAMQYDIVHSISKKYIYNSNQKYITALYNNAKYTDEDKLIVVFNQEMNEFSSTITESDTKYNPSLNDGVWDENDWYYSNESSDPENLIEMNGENIWYYRKPGSESTSGDSEDGSDLNVSKDVIGSGFIIEASSYLGSITFEKDEEYYIAFDVETNFDGTLNIFCNADSGVKSSNDRAYYIRNGEKKHISQVFTANDNTTPEFRVLKYDFKNNPIAIGDYVVLSNMKITKSHSSEFIPKDISSYQQLDYIYKTNKAIYKWLVQKMRETDDKKMYSIYKKLYDSLMISKYNKEVFKLNDGTYAKTYTDFLYTRDEVLYDRLIYFKSLEESSMQEAINNEIIELTYALDSVLGEYDYKYLYSYMPGASISFIQDYIHKVINWFKSWKVQLLDMTTVYHLGGNTSGSTSGLGSWDENDYLIKLLQDHEYKIKVNSNMHDGFVYGYIKINPDPNDKSADGINTYKDIMGDELEEFNYKYSDKIRIRDRVRIIVRETNTIEYADFGANLHIKLTDDTTKVSVTDTNKLGISTINGDEFRTHDTNKLLMTTDEEDDDMFASQIIDEINLLSGDYIEYDEMEDEC